MLDIPVRIISIVIVGAVIVGSLGMLIACFRYPPIDLKTLVQLPMLFVVFVALVLARFTIKPSKKIVGGVVAIVLCISAIFLFLNGSLDNYPPAEIEARVIAKSVRYGKAGGYVLTIAPSWRDGRTEENLPVSGATFYMIAEARLVQVVVHPGAFGLPWFSSVLPE